MSHDPTTPHGDGPAIFDEYATYYDLLYPEKDSKAEAAFVLERLAAHTGQPKTLLEFGTGSGRHAEHFVRQGVTVTGVERSPRMLTLATARNMDVTCAMGERLTYVQEDIRTLRLPRTFDAVVALFHVMSYMTTPQDLAAAMNAASRHLRPGGAFLFDYWYGPCVTAQPPQRTEKHVDAEDVRLHRRTTPTMDPAAHTVTVHFDLTVEREGAPPRHISEDHIMRYLFQPEVTAAMDAAGLDLVEQGEWLTRREPSPETFGVYAVGVKRA